MMSRKSANISIQATVSLVLALYSTWRPSLLAAATDRAVLLFDVVQVVLIIFSKQTHLLSRTGPVQLLQCGRVRERLAKTRTWLALALADKHWLFCNLFPTIKVFLSFFIFRWRCLWVRLPSQPQMGAGLLQGTSNILHHSSPFRITLIGDDWLEIVEKDVFAKSGLVVCTSGAYLAGWTALQYRSQHIQDI